MKYLGQLFIFSFLLFFSSCENSTEPNLAAETGDVFIEVITNSNTGSGIQKYPVRDARVSLKGTGYSAVTNGYGQVLFKNVPPGNYEATAYQVGHGSGKTIVNIKSNIINNVTLEYYIGLLAEPKVYLNTNSSGNYIAVGDTLKLVGRVTDNETPGDSLPLNVYLKNKLLSTIQPDSAGYFNFKYIAPQRDTLKFIFTTQDQDKFVGKDSISFTVDRPQRVQIISATVDPKGVNLRWTKSNDPLFAYYTITTNYLSGLCDIYTIYDKNITSIMDTLVPLVSELYYTVKIYDTNGKYSSSAEYRVKNPAGELFNFSVYDAVIHPDQPYLYMISQLSSSTYKLIAYNYETKKIFNEMIIYEYTDMKVEDNGFGTELYISAGNKILIYDAWSLNVTREILGFSTFIAFAVDGNKHVFTVTYENSNYKLRCYNLENGAIVNKVSITSTAELEKVPGKKLLIGSGRSYAGINYYSYNDNYTSITETRKSYYNAPLQISSDGQYLAADDYGEIFSIEDNLIHLGRCSHNDHLKAYTFSHDNAYVYASDTYGNFWKFEILPQINTVSTYKSKGIPLFLFHRDGKLISVTQASTSHSVIEYIDL